MFKAILEEQKRVEKELKRDRDLAQAAACQSVSHVVSQLVDLTDEGASNAFKQQQRIGKEVRDIKVLITKVERQLGQYATSLQHVHHALKQFGDIEHFLQVVDAEVQSVCATLAALKPPAASPEGTTTAHDDTQPTQHQPSS